MNSCGCEHCRDVCQSFKITLPRDLTKAIKVVKDNIAVGTILESDYWPTKHIKIELEPFSKVNAEGPWGDYLEYYFECSRCGQLFRLSAETYRGSGGGWEPLERTGI